jgi:hypothetical protein
MNVRNGSIDAVDISRRIRSFFYSYLFTSLNSIIDLNAKNPDVRFCLAEIRVCTGCKADIGIGWTRLTNSPSFEAALRHAYRGKPAAIKMAVTFKIPNSS